MKKQGIKKIIPALLTASLVAVLFLCGIFAEDITIPSSNEKKHVLSGKEGLYEEINLSEDFETTFEENSYSNKFYVENENETDLYLLKIANFETAYEININGWYIPANKTEINITDYILTGDNVNEIVIEAERISGTIKIVHTPTLALGSVSIVPDIDKGEITAKVSIRNRSEETLTGSLEIAIYELGVFKDDNRAMHISVGSETLDFEIEPNLTDTESIENIHLNDYDETRLWTTDNPFMYEIVVKLGENQISSYFCMRTIGEDSETGYKTLNGQPVFVRAYRVTDEAELEDLSIANINALIKTDGFSSELQEKAAKAGLLLFEDSDFAEGTLFEITEETPDEIAKIRAERTYKALATSDKTIAAESFSEVGISVDLDAEEAGRGEKFCVDVSVINDMSEDLSDAVATFEVTHKGVVIFSESKEYESLKKLGTQGRDVMTREFEFEIPSTVKDGESIKICIKIKNPSGETTWTKYLNIAGGVTYEAPYSRLAVIVTLCSVFAIITVTAVVAAVRNRKEKKK